MKVKRTLKGNVKVVLTPDEASWFRAYININGGQPDVAPSLIGHNCLDYDIWKSLKAIGVK